MIASLLVHFYRFWHGRLHLKGAGLLLRCALPFVPDLSSFHLKLPEGQTIVVDFRDVSATYWLNHLLGDRFEEEGLLAAVKQLIQKDTVIWDVGANCGLFSYRLATESNGRKINFFEPNPSMFSLSRSALQLFPHVSGFQNALSNHSGNATFIIPAGESPIGTLEAHRTERNGREMQVECRTGDELVANRLVEAPHILKIDTEGHELAVILGIRQIIKDHKPVIFFEHISLTDAEITGMVPDGYELFSVSDRDGSLSPGFDRAHGHNAALLPVS